MKKLITLISLIAIIGCSDNKPKLHIYTWADYYNPDIINKFEKEYNCQVCIDTFDSNESMYAKIKSGASGYDIINPTSYQIKSLIKDDMIVKMDTNLLPNVMSNYYTNYESNVFSPSLVYTVPYAISYGCLVYNKNKVSDEDIRSWHVIGNPKYRGRVSILDDIRETIGIGLFVNGKNINSGNQTDINMAVNYINSIKRNIRKFDCESYKNEIANGSTWIGHGYSGDILQLIVGEDESSARDDIGISYPKEGFTISTDEFVIMKDSRHIKLAHEFINFIYDPENCKNNMEYVLSFTPNKKAIDLLDDKIRKLMVLDDETLKRAQMSESFDDCPDKMDMFNKAWDEIKKFNN